MSHSREADAPTIFDHPRPVAYSPPRHSRLPFPRTWRDARDAAIALFFVSASVPMLALGWVVLGRPR